jgi:DNA-binding MarR family transcriptional regulator
MNADRDDLRAASALRTAIARINRRLRTQDEAGGVGSTGLSLLGRLYRSGPCTASELAAREGLQPQSLTRTLQMLEERGLISRETDDDDRRRSTITIMDTGLFLLHKVMRTREAWLARAMESTLSPTERELLRLAASLLERLADADPDADADADA